MHTYTQITVFFIRGKFIIKLAVLRRQQSCEMHTEINKVKSQGIWASGTQQISLIIPFSLLAAWII